MLVGRRYLEDERTCLILFRSIDVSFGEKYDLRIVGHVDIADRLECFSGERVGLEAFLTEAAVGHYFFQNGGTSGFFIVWVIPFSHRLVFFVGLLFG